MDYHQIMSRIVKTAVDKTKNDLGLIIPNNEMITQL